MSADLTVCLGLRCGTQAELARDNGGVFTYGAGRNDHATWDRDSVRGCSCRDGFAGADCAERVCPTGLDPEEMYSVVDTSTLTAHTCSNRGLCDALTGECACFPGYGSSVTLP